MGRIKQRLPAAQSLWGDVTEMPRLGNQAPCLPQGRAASRGPFSRQVLCDMPRLQPAPAYPGQEKKGAFSLTLFPFVLVRLPVWGNYFVQGHAATEGSRSTVHFTYNYAGFYFILPGRASEKRILKGYSN